MTSRTPTPIRYDVDLSRRLQHLVAVRVTIPADAADGARLVLPVWTPGSYFVRDYVHHLQRISARSSSGAELALQPDGRTAWRLPSDGQEPVQVELELYANQLTVRSNHVDDRHALLTPAATFPYVEGATARRHEVTVSPPRGWRVWSLLPAAEVGDDARPTTFVADDYDHLVDSAFEAGAHEEVGYEVAGVPHRLVWAGPGPRPALDRLAADAAQIGEAAAAVFQGDLPTRHYTFLCETWDSGGGGLEHRDGAVLQASVHGLRTPDDYARFQSLVAHEYFHIWNVKRLTPAALTRLDYERPVHSSSLWVAEGWTAYYDELLLARSGLWKVSRYLESTAGVVRRVLERPGRELQSVRMASHDAWTKYYVRDENSPNVGVSYYEHGAVLAWCLDLILRAERPDGDGLDDVLRLLWKRFGGDATAATGYEERDVEEAASEVAGQDLSAFFSDHVGGVQAPPVEELIGTVGLRLTDKRADDPLAPDLGIEMSEDDQGVVVTSVLRQRPAWRAGVTGGDRLLAIGGLRVGRGELKKALLAHAPGDTVEVAVFRGPRLLLLPVTLGPPRGMRQLRPVEQPSADQREAFRRWCGQNLPSS